MRDVILVILNSLRIKCHIRRPLSHNTDMLRVTCCSLLGHFRRYGRTCRTLWHGLSCRLRSIGRFLYGHNVLHTQ